MKNINAIPIIVSVVFAATAWSCIEEATNVELPSSLPKLVVYSFISPGDTIKAKVYKSNPIFNEPGASSYYAIPDATVTISDDKGNLMEIPFQPAKEQYSISPSQFKIEEGKIYNLTVSALGLETVTATTTVPNVTPSFSGLRLDSLRSNDGFFNTRNDYFILGALEDQPDAKNYYRVNAYEYYYNSIAPNYYYENDSKIDDEFFSDAGFEGGSINFKTKIGSSHFDSIYFIALKTDYSYYTYHKSMLKFDNSNPFIEPTPVYSNITNGLGVFGSYLKTQIMVKPEELKNK